VAVHRRVALAGDAPTIVADDPRTGNTIEDFVTGLLHFFF
jgi:hypothetical protein